MLKTFTKLFCFPTWFQSKHIEKNNRFSSEELLLWRLALMLMKRSRYWSLPYQHQALGLHVRRFSLLRMLMNAEPHTRMFQLLSSTRPLQSNQRNLRLNLLCLRGVSWWDHPGLGLLSFPTRSQLTHPLKVLGVKRVKWVKKYKKHLLRSMKMRLRHRQPPQQLSKRRLRPKKLKRLRRPGVRD